MGWASRRARLPVGVPTPTGRKSLKLKVSSNLRRSNGLLVLLIRVAGYDRVFWPIKSYRYISHHSRLQLHREPCVLKSLPYALRLLSVCCPLSIQAFTDNKCQKCPEVWPCRPSSIFLANQNLCRLGEPHRDIPVLTCLVKISYQSNHGQFFWPIKSCSSTSVGSSCNMQSS
jgi:hypothetical protein